MIAFVMVSIVPFQDLNWNSPFSQIFVLLEKPALEILFTLSAIITIVYFRLLNINIVPYALKQLSTDGLFITYFSKMKNKRNSLCSIFIYGMFCIFFSMIFDINPLIQMVTIAILFTNILICSSVILLRYSYSIQSKPTATLPSKSPQFTVPSSITKYGFSSSNTKHTQSLTSFNTNMNRIQNMSQYNNYLSPHTLQNRKKKSSIDIVNDNIDIGMGFGLDLDIPSIANNPSLISCNTATIDETTVLTMDDTTVLTDTLTNSNSTLSNYQQFILNIIEKSKMIDTLFWTHNKLLILVWIFISLSFLISYLIFYTDTVINGLPNLMFFIIILLFILLVFIFNIFIYLHFNVDWYKWLFIGIVGYSAGIEDKSNLEMKQTEPLKKGSVNCASDDTQKLISNAVFLTSYDATPDVSMVNELNEEKENCADDNLIENVKKIYFIPFSPFLPLLCILVNCCMIASLDLEACLRVLMLYIIGIVVYFMYGYRFSKLNSVPKSLMLDNKIDSGGGRYRVRSIDSIVDSVVDKNANAVNHKYMSEVV